MNYTIGLDVGGTKINAGLVTKNGKIVKRVKIPTEAKEGKKKILENINQAIKKVWPNAQKNSLWQKEVAAIGIGIAGQVDPKSGLYYSGPNFAGDFSNLPLAKILTKIWRRPIYLENDANCFTLGEVIYGAGKKYQYIIGVTLGTGIGAGIILDKKIYRGKDGLAGEVGHMTIDIGGEVCGCGQYGHLETLASSKAMKKLYEQITGYKASAFEIEERALRGDKNAHTVIQAITEYLSIGLANLINIFNPDVIILGGGISRVKPIWQTLEAEVKKRVFHPVLKKTPVIKSKLGDDAAILGAILITNLNKF